MHRYENLPAVLVAMIEREKREASRPVTVSLSAPSVDREAYNRFMAAQDAAETEESVTVDVAA